ncbi:LITAF-like zinc ribbon domain-containing protein [Phthorimaea operculella]|nr:LITAF-like zinc ribbon domain-containing protein [Phthorimaea operculella]
MKDLAVQVLYGFFYPTKREPSGRETPMVNMEVMKLTQVGRIGEKCCWEHRYKLVQKHDHLNSGDRNCNYQDVRPTMTLDVPLGRYPVSMRCPSCGANITTITDHKSTTKTHIIALLLCAFIMWPCLLVPYFTTCCRDADHYCPLCSAYIGTYKN